MAEKQMYSEKMDTSSGLQFLFLHPFVRTTAADKLSGVVLGSALGDCIGLYTEFLSKQLSWDAYPSAKFQLVEPTTLFKNDGHRNKFTMKSWTDDTDHALLIILSYLHNDGKLLPNDLAARLRIWVEQGLRCLDRLPLGLGRTVGRVVLDKNYLSHPTLTAHKYWVASNHTAAPNGSLMRTHPLGIICIGKSLEETFQIATAFSLVTHADTRCIVACCISTSLIRGMLRGEVLNEKNVDSLVDTAFDWVNAWQKRGRKFEEETQADDEWVDASAPVNDGDVDENENSTDAQPQTEQQQPEPPLDLSELHKHTKAKAFADLNLDDSMAMGYVYKSLGSAILSLRLAMRSSQNPFSRTLTSPSQSPLPVTSNNNKFKPPYPTTTINLFETLITDLIMHGGDADTNACIAGALLGAWLGYTALPPHWRDGLEHHDWLVQKCYALAHVVGVMDAEGRDKVERYKGSADPDTAPDGGRGLLGQQALEAREKDFMENYLKKGFARVEEERRRTRGWKGKLGLR